MSFLIRHRWALALALLQVSFFATFCVSEHRRYVRYRRGRALTEYVDCFPLTGARPFKEGEWDLGRMECYSTPTFKLLVLSNAPVFAVWGVIANATQNTNLNQLKLFYAANGLGIAAFWLFIGSRIDRRRSLTSLSTAQPDRVDSPHR